LKIETVHFDYNTVNLIGKLFSFLIHLMVVFDHFIDIFAFLNMGINSEPPFREGLKDLPMGLKRMTSYFSDSIAIDFEGAAGCDLRIELADRPSRRIPRIGEKRFIRLLPLAVKLPESIKLHDHFPTDLQSFRNRDLLSNELKRNGFDGA
jgi:hypothetical protein